MSDTTITINGVNYELKNMSTENGAKLFSALGSVKGKTNYKQLAAQISQLAYDFQLIVPLPELPDGVGPQEGFDKVKQMMADSANGAKKSADPYLTSVRDKFMSIGVVKSAADSVETASDIGSILGTPMKAWNGVKRSFIDVPRAVWGAADETKNEVAAKIDSKVNHITKAQADTLGAAYAAAIYAQVEGPNAPETTRSKEPNLLDKGVAKFESFTQGFWGSGIGQFLTTVGHFLTNIFKGKGFDWTLASSEAAAIAAQSKSQPTRTYEQILASNMVEKVEPNARGNVATLFTAAGNIAGVETLGFAQTLNGKSVYRGHDGVYKTVEFKDGKPIATPIMDDGKPLTADQRSSNRWSKLKDEVLPTSVGGGIGQVATAIPGFIVGSIWKGASNLFSGDDDKKVDAQKEQKLAEQKLAEQKKAQQKVAQEKAAKEGNKTASVQNQDHGLMEAAGDAFEKARKAVFSGDTSAFAKVKEVKMGSSHQPGDALPTTVIGAAAQESLARNA